MEPSTPVSFPADAPIKKIFREKAIWGGTLLGGPLAAGYIMAHNYKIFGAPDKARNAWIISILSTLAILWLAFHLPANVKIPNQIIPLVYSGIASALINHYQGKQIKTYLEQGGVHFNGWRVLTVGLLAMVPMFLIAFAFVYLSDPAFSSDSKKYGAMGNTIFYKQSNLSLAAVDSIAASFQDVGFFTNQKQVSVYAKNEKGAYELSLPVRENAWNEPEIVAAFKGVRDAMQAEFPTHAIVIKLVSGDDIEDVKKTFQ